MPFGPLTLAISPARGPERTSTSTSRVRRVSAIDVGSGCSARRASSARPDGADAAGGGVSPQLIKNGMTPAERALLVTRHRSRAPSEVVRLPSVTSPRSTPAACARASATSMSSARIAQPTSPALVTPSTP